MAAIPPFDADLLRRYDRPGPRYTSYPTAPQFKPGFGETDFARAARLSNDDPIPRRLSLYAHVPFCFSPCFYCGCNRIITRDKARAGTYLSRLVREVAMLGPLFDRDREVLQVHLGGGTPNFFTASQIGELLESLNTHFRFSQSPTRDFSIELDPRFVDRGDIEALAFMGFNRASLGVQDFDPAVQEAVNRIQSVEETNAVIRNCRRSGFRSVNVDLIYGLPLQTPESFKRTLAQVAQLRPDRIALYAYAHLPSRFKPQRRIIAAELPSPGDKLSMLSMSLDAMSDAGYVYVGMDHFALPTDALAVAKRQGRLHRNFQGYSTRPDCDLIALGVSAIGRVGATYSQNAKTLEEYYDLLDQGRLPIVRGLALNRDDLLRRAVIMSIMCQGELSFESIDLGHLIDSRTYFAREFIALRPLAEAGLVELDDSGLQVTARGWYLVRAIAMVFDRHLQTDRDRARFSKII